MSFECGIKRFARSGYARKSLYNCNPHFFVDKVLTDFVLLPEPEPGSNVKCREILVKGSLVFIAGMFIARPDIRFEVFVLLIIFMLWTRPRAVVV